ncbi:MAG: hypothetical protein KC421_30790, partial [Anaerolineales bacterium]|nr:hypothetical protein [Anaerolineales bacterium]
YETPTNWGVTDQAGAFDYFPGETVKLWVGSLYLGEAYTDLKISPLDIFMVDIEDPQVTNMARLLQTLDADGDPKQGIDIKPSVAGCLDMALGELGLTAVDFADDIMIQAVIDETLYYCQGNPEANLIEVSAADAQANLEDGISESGIYRKNISKTEEWGEDNQKLEVMPVYFPGVRSNGEPTFCDMNDNNLLDEGEEGVPYEEWRLNGDPDGETCDPRYDGDACQVTLIECREVAKPIVVTYLQEVDIFAENVTTAFYSDRFSNDVFTAISRDDGATWKRMNVSRMADLTSFTLETGEPFPGTTRSPQMKIIDNNILVVWTSTYARGGNPRYAITTCDDPLTSEVETPETGCQLVCRGDPDQGTEVCEPDYPYDDEYYVTDIWGVRGQQQSVNYDEVDDVADLNIGEIPYSALWAARGVIVTQAELDAGTFASIDYDDPETPEDESLQVGDIIWYKPERLTSARRDSYIPVVAGTRGAGFVIAWQEDPEGLRPGKGKGPGQGWSGAISNHKTDIWYSFITIDDFNIVDENFVPGGEPDEDRPGLGRPKALVPFTLPIRISDNDMVNTDTLKVELDGNGLPVVTDGTYTPLDPADVEHGNAVGTKRYAYMAASIDDNSDGVPDYQYYVDGGGTLNLCDTSENQDLSNLMTVLPGTTAHERWYRFINTEGSEKTVCVTEDGRLLDGDVSASRPNISLQPYTRADGTKSAWVLLAYEESKGMGHPHAEDTSGGGQVPQPIRQDYGKDVIYHTFDFTQPDLVNPGHVVNLPALGGGLYLNYCESLGFAEWDPSYDRICTAEGGEPIPLYFETQNEDGSFTLSEDFVQYRTEIARRTRFIAQAYSKLGANRLAAAIIYKQGQEGQGRPADVFIRRIVVPTVAEGFNPKVDNPFAFENFECTTYLDETFPDLPGYNHNVWGEPYGDRLCGGIFTDPNGGYERRDHVNLTSADIDLSVDAGPEDDTPDDPTDDIYGTDKVLLWSQYNYNLGDESYGYYNGEDGFSGMFSNARSHRGFIRGDFLVTAYAFSPNWAAARNGRDRYNFYLRKSFDGGQTWTTTPADLGGVGVNYCQEWRTDPVTHEAPIVEGFDPECVDWCA